MTQLRGVVWDLDDTLAMEHDYVRSGFRAVADYVGGLGVDPDAAMNNLYGGFEQGVRGNAFDRLLADFPLLQGRVEVADLVTRYREHQPHIAVAPGMSAILDDLAARHVRQGVISDGPLASQAAKDQALDLSRWCDPVILTDAWGRDYWKPHERAFRAVEAAWCLAGPQLAYVGDNPGKDFVAPNALGWRTVRLRLPRQVRYDAPDGDHPADATVRSASELAAWLEAALNET